jgi:hypothetical protein
MSPFEENFTVPNDLNPGNEITKKVKEFIRKFKILEVENSVPLILIFDKRSEAFYSVCHLDSETLTTKSDLDAVLDPAESEEYKLNRNIYTDTYSYRLMEKDALRGRSFEDIVVEYDVSYRPDLPLKVFGGQHRVMAIKESARQGTSAVHGVRVYFDLNVEQKVNIAMASNTAIAVSNDLLDRMQEDLLGTDLRNWCQSVGLLDNDQHFADRKNPEGIPTVRIARTLIVNYYMGKLTEKEGMNLPVVCSSGKGVDRNYKKIRDGIQWTDRNFIRMGKKFSRLHKLQREAVLNRHSDNSVEFANKAINPCVAASWAFAAGYFQDKPDALNIHYALTDQLEPGQDPLNTKALSMARLKDVDPVTYPGLGSRISSVELGRIVELFLLHATRAKKPGITLRLANAAIKNFEAKRTRMEAERALRGI